MKKKKAPGKSTPLALFFLAILCGIIVFSFVVKFFFIVSEGKFNSGNTFSIFVSNGVQNQLIVFDNENGTITKLKVSERTGDPNKTLEVPIEALYFKEDMDLNKSLPDLLSDLFLGIAITKNNLNPADGFRSYLSSRFSSPKNISEKEVSIKTPETQRDQELSSIFSDKKILDEGYGIDVINGTSEGGIGGRISRLASNIGGNVLLVGSEENVKNSAIYADKDSYTAKRLSGILNFPIKKGRISKIAEISIVIGEDYRDITKY